MKIRDAIAAIVRILPRYETTRILVQWCGLLAVVLGAGWTVWTYSRSVRAEIMVATFNMHREYRADFGDYSETFMTMADGSDSDDVRLRFLSVTCLFLAEETEAGRLALVERTLPDCKTIQLRDRALLEEIGASKTPEQNAILRDRITKVSRNELSVNKTVAQELELFYRALVFCAQKARCDRQTVATLFGPDMVSFVNAVCSALADRPPQAAADLRAIVDFVVTNDVSLAGARRSHPIVCEHLRQSDDPA